MNELTQTVLGWLAYLERPAVLLQLVLVAAAALGPGQLRARLPQAPPAMARIAGLALLTLGCLLLGLLRLPAGLAIMLGLLGVGWWTLDRLQELLVRWLPQEDLRRLDSRLIRPTFLVLAGLLLISQLDSIAGLAVIPLGRVFGVALTVGKLSTALAVSYLLLVGSRPPAESLAWLAHRTLRISHSSRRALALMLRYGMVGLGLLAVADRTGLNATALIAVAGGLSVGLGFGVKEVFSNFISGLWLLFEGSVRPGEVLMIDGDACEVRHLGLRATLLWRERDNAELLIPNQLFFTQQATSYTASDRLRCCELRLQVSSELEPARAFSLLEATALEVKGVLPTPAPRALLLGFEGSTATYALRFWIAQPLESGPIGSAVHQTIWSAFAREGLTIESP